MAKITALFFGVGGGGVGRARKAVLMGRAPLPESWAGWGIGPFPPDHPLYLGRKVKASDYEQLIPEIFSLFFLISLQKGAQWGRNLISDASDLQKRTQEKSLFNLLGGINSTRASPSSGNFLGFRSWKKMEGDAIDLTGDGGVLKKIVRRAKPDAFSPSESLPLVDGMSYHDQFPIGFSFSCLATVKIGSLWVLPPFLEDSILIIRTWNHPIPEQFVCFICYSNFLVSECF